MTDGWTDRQTGSDLLTTPEGHMGSVKINVALAHPYHPYHEGK